MRTEDERVHDVQDVAVASDREPNSELAPRARAWALPLLCPARSTVS